MRSAAGRSMWRAVKVCAKGRRWLWTLVYVLVMGSVRTVWAEGKGGVEGGAGDGGKEAVWANVSCGSGTESMLYADMPPLEEVFWDGSEWREARAFGASEYVI